MNAENRSDRLVRELQNAASYPHEVAEIELVETHISWVFLTGPYAYKIKKPVALPFLDFSTLERRRYFCEEELRLNRRLAPDLYLAVVPIGGSERAPRIGETPAIEYAVQLRQFDNDAMADRKLARNEISGDSIVRLAQLIAGFHAGLPPSDGKPITHLAIENIGELDEALRAAGEPLSVARLRDWTTAQCERLGDVFDERVRNGAVREGHGDLHLENLVVVDGELLPFDCLEFDPALRSTDVIDEAGFLVMDLIAHGRADFALLFLNRYLELTGDYAGTRLLRFYLLYRALVRAKVGAIKAAQPHSKRSVGDRVRPYLRLASELVETPAPLLLITHGLSGSGKTTITDQLLTRLPALRVRSDLERKRLHGVDAAAHEKSNIAEGRYDPAATEKTYRRLADCAADALAGGLDVIVDATFLSRSRRDEFRRLAHGAEARFAILDCSAPEETLRKRVSARAAARADASEATEDVLDHQLKNVEPLAEEEGEDAVVVDTSAEIDYDALAASLTARRARRTRRPATP